MTTKLKFLTKMSLKKKMINKWFLIANLVLGLSIIAIANIDTIISAFGGDFNETTKIEVIDNTNSFTLLKSNFEETNKYLENMKPAEVTKYTKTYKDAIKEVKKDGVILITLDTDATTTIKAKVIANTNIDELLYSSITTSINATKAQIALANSNISIEELNRIYSPASITKEYLDKDSDTANNELIMGMLFPILILPFFMLSIYLVQMIGAEINDEKTTRGMEIIIGNVSPKTHFFSKVISGNVFVLLQGALLLLFSGIGMLVRTFTGAESLTKTLGADFADVWKTLVDSGFIDKLVVIIPVTLILMIMTFLAYSLLAGILASMTTSIEDYQQIQMPIIMISLAGYYLSIMSTMFSGSLFIKLMSYVPFISALLSPALLILGEITIFDLLISLVLLSGTIYVLIKYGLRIYKIGILNYSSSKLWTKIFKAIKNEDVAV